MAVAYASTSSGVGIGTSGAVATLATGSGTGAIALSVGVPTGATLCIFVGAAQWSGGDTVSITDNASGNPNASAYTQCDPASGMTIDVIGSDFYAASFIGNNIQGNPTVITVHFSHTGGVTFPIITVDCFTNTLASALGNHNLTAPGATGTGVNAISGTAYSSTAGSALWACCLNINSNAQLTAGTTLTWVQGVAISGNEGISEYILVGPGGSNAYTFGNANSGDDKFLLASMEVKAAPVVGLIGDWIMLV